MTNVRRFMSIDRIHEFLNTIHAVPKLPVPQKDFFLRFRYISIGGSINARKADLGIFREFMVKEFFGRSSSTREGIREMMICPAKFDISAQRKPYFFFSASIHIKFQTIGIMESKTSIGMSMWFQLVK